MCDFQKMTSIPLPPIDEDSVTRIMVECYHGWGEYRDDAHPRFLRLREQADGSLDTTAVMNARLRDARNRLLAGDMLL